jgi:hypothetical protein
MLLALDFFAALLAIERCTPFSVFDDCAGIVEIAEPVMIGTQSAQLAEMRPKNTYSQKTRTKNRKLSPNSPAENQYE